MERGRPGRTALAAAAVLLLTGQQVVAEGPLTRLDTAVETFLVPRRDGTLGDAARALTHLGEPSVAVPLLVLAALAVAVQRRAPRVAVVAAGLAVALAVTVLGLKGLVARPAAHGSTTHGGSWPSGHTASATVVWGALAAALGRSSGLRAALAVGVPLVVAVCLVVGGYHQVADVVAGGALGALLLAGAQAALTADRRGHERQPSRSAQRE